MNTADGVWIWMKLECGVTVRLQLPLSKQVTFFWVAPPSSETSGYCKPINYLLQTKRAYVSVSGAGFSLQHLS